MLNIVHFLTFVIAVVTGIIWWQDGSEVAQYIIWMFWISLVVFMVITVARMGGFEDDGSGWDFGGGDGGDGGGD